MTREAGDVTLVLGGVRSGKSRHAEDIAKRRRLACVYLATAEARDDEMTARVAQHRARRGSVWTTIEEPLELAVAIARESRTDRVVLVDCLTLWLSNLMHAARDIDLARSELAASLARAAGPVILVANEIGLGIVPDNALARAFRDHAGHLNQTIAALARRVVFVAAGLPLVLKDSS
jgi:adenosylcobinamide kinase/adenosylcobinamide-phosphate guanylyltransferase